MLEADRGGRASELGRLVLFRDEVVPARGRRPPPIEGGGPWKADMACELRNGMGGLRGAGEIGRLDGSMGVRRPDM